MAVVGRVREIWRYAVKSMGGERLERCEVDRLGVAGDRGWALRDEAAGEMRGAKKIPGLLQCAARYVEEPAGGKIPHVVISLPDGGTVSSDDPAAAERISALAGRRLTLHARRPSSDEEFYRRAPPDSADFETELRSIFGRLPDEPLPDLAAFPSELFEFTSPLGTYFDAFPLHLLTTASLATMRRAEPSADFDTRRFRPNFLIEVDGDRPELVEAKWVGRTIRVGDVAIDIRMPTVRCVMTTLAQGDLAKQPRVLRTIVRQAEQSLGVYAAPLAGGRVAVGDPVELLDS